MPKSESSLPSVETLNQYPQVLYLLTDIVDDADNAGCENCYVVSASLIDKARKLIYGKSDD